MWQSPSSDLESAFLDLVVEGRLLLGGEIQDAAIGIENGMISRVARHVPGDERICISNGIIIPAFVDSHVHMREPGGEKKEDFRTGTTAAVFGGVTTVLDMPNTNPPTLNLSGFEAKHELARAKSLCDFGLYMGVQGNSQPSDIPDSAVGYKLYLGATTGPLLVRDMETIARTVSMAAQNGVPVALHGEDQDVLEREGRRPEDLKDHARLRPPEAEVRAIGKLLSMDTRWLHLCHLSSKEGLDALGEWKGTVEVTPHHLLLDNTVSLEVESYGKVNPPLRHRSHRIALWEAVLSGRIDTMGSDHAPHTEVEKDDDFSLAPSGLPGVETMGPLMLAQVAKKRLPLPRLVELLAANPAGRFGLAKGEIREGMDADLQVVDIRTLKKIDPGNLHSRCGWTPYEGMEAVFPTMVICRGEVAVEDGELAVRPGFGRGVRRC